MSLENALFLLLVKDYVFSLLSVKPAFKEMQSTIL